MCKWIHKPISLFFYYCIYPFLNGYYSFMIKYFLSIKQEEVKFLKDYGFSDIRPFKSRSWRIGGEVDHAYRRYYTANCGSTLCFIKVAQNDSTIFNEISVAEQLAEKNIRFISKVMASDTNFAGGKQMLATEFIRGLHPISKESVYNDVEIVTAPQLIDCCKQMLKILDTLESLQLVHADIHKGNLMLDDNDNLILLDFGISKFLNRENDVNYSLRPGTFYRELAEGRIYDDAYSFLKLICRYESCKEIENDDAYKDICYRIDKVQLCVKI